MDASLTILYRGPLASCDYDCGYCPFAKRRDSPEQLRADRAALARFIEWVAAAEQREHGEKISVLFTPWGEALTRSWYRNAIVELSHLPHVGKVAVQTNLSCRLGWLDEANRDTTALWCTYHPDQVEFDRFVAKHRHLLDLGIRHSIGIVGQPEHLDAARRLREAIDDGVYLWVNAAEGKTYTDAEAADWTAIDPLFEVSRHAHPSLGRDCRTGETVISVDGDGNVRRCHFVPRTDPTEHLGNLYDGSFRAALRPRPCPLKQCDCHIGYVHMPELGLYGTFRGGVLERVPAALLTHTLTPAGAPMPRT
ncbi:STM4011 family radical SAM protein [Actinospica robiniae]|uniref:STM4011 family radical SAM protein n=1 Tax=Actinospica robiniae TaxID=304901 RepID=UPI0004183219|nr:STM4011 family radical SAM protein [Actinospica robiniae]